jgi:hypothetical protein
MNATVAKVREQRCPLARLKNEYAETLLNRLTNLVGEPGDEEQAKAAKEKLRSEIQKRMAALPKPETIKVEPQSIIRPDIVFDITETTFVYNWATSDPPNVNYTGPNAAANEIFVGCTFPYPDGEPSNPDYVAAGIGLLFAPTEGGWWTVTPRADINTSWYNLDGATEGLFLVTMDTYTNGQLSGSPQTVQTTLWNFSAGSSLSPISQNSTFVETPQLAFFLNPPNEYIFWVWVYVTQTGESAGVINATVPSINFYMDVAP